MGKFAQLTLYWGRFSTGDLYKHFKVIDRLISFYSRNTHLLPLKPKSSLRRLKRDMQDFHMDYVLVPADKAVNNVVVV